MGVKNAPEVGVDPDGVAGQVQEQEHGGHDQQQFGDLHLGAMAWRRRRLHVCRHTSGFVQRHLGTLQLLLRLRMRIARRVPRPLPPIPSACTPREGDRELRALVVEIGDLEDDADVHDEDAAGRDDERDERVDVVGDGDHVTEARQRTARRAAGSDLLHTGSPRSERVGDDAEQREAEHDLPSPGHDAHVL